MQDDEEVYSTLINMCGYKHTFSRNLLIVTLILMTLIIVTVGFYIFAKLSSCLQRKKAKDEDTKASRRSQRTIYAKAAWMSNFSLRFVYEFFFEILICFLLNLTAF